jgi:hypothetical protein
VELGDRGSLVVGQRGGADVTRETVRHDVVGFERERPPSLVRLVGS